MCTHAAGFRLGLLTGLPICYPMDFKGLQGLLRSCNVSLQSIIALKISVSSAFVMVVLGELSGVILQMCSSSYYRHHPFLPSNLESGLFPNRGAWRFDSMSSPVFSVTSGMLLWLYRLFIYCSVLLATRRTLVCKSSTFRCKW